MRLKTLLEKAEERDSAVVRNVTDSRIRITVCDENGDCADATFVTNHKGNFDHALYAEQRVSLKYAAKMLGF